MSGWSSGLRRQIQGLIRKACIVLYEWDSGLWLDWLIDCFLNSPEKWLHNRICYPSNPSRQIKETHTAYSAGTPYTRQSWMKNNMHAFTDNKVLCVKPCMQFFIQTLPRVFVCRLYQPCEFLEFVWTDCWGNKSNYVITSPANTSKRLMHIVFSMHNKGYQSLLISLVLVQYWHWNCSQSMKHDVVHNWFYHFEIMQKYLYFPYFFQLRG